MNIRPTFQYERALLQDGYEAVVGVDEAGAGALAGPLVAGAVMLPLDSRIGGLRDSKTLSEKQKEELYEMVLQKSHAWGVGIVSVQEIYDLGLRPANLLAMKRAVEMIPSADFALVDAWEIKGLSIPQKGIVKGDAKVKSIAAASIIAKVTRDRIMKGEAEKYPEYGFDRHVGYGTKLHREMIEVHGPCPIHRLRYKTFQ